MWGTVKESVALAAEIATSLAMLFAGVQLAILNRQQRIDSHHNFISSEREIWLAALNNPRISKNIVENVWSTSLGNDPSSTLFVAIFLDNIEHMYRRYESGMLPKRTWRSIDAYVDRLFGVSIIRSSWADIRAEYDHDFATYLDGKIRNARTAAHSSP